MQIYSRKTGSRAWCDLGADNSSRYDTRYITRAHSSVHAVQACSRRIITSLPTHTHTVVFDRVAAARTPRLAADTKLCCANPDR